MRRILIPTDNILVLLLHSNSMEKSNLTDWFVVLFNDNLAYFFGPPCIKPVWHIRQVLTCSVGNILLEGQ